MAIESTILSEFLAPPEMAADTANPRGSQDFSQFLNAVTPDVAVAVNPTPPAVGNPTPPAADTAPPGGEEMPPPLQAMLMIADQLGLEAKPASAAVPAPNRVPAGAALQTPVTFNAAAADGALPEVLTAPPQGKGDAAADDGDDAVNPVQNDRTDVPVPLPVVDGALARPMPPNAAPPATEAGPQAGSPVQPRAVSALASGVPARPAVVSQAVAAPSLPVPEVAAIKDDQAATAASAIAAAAAQALPMPPTRADGRMQGARANDPQPAVAQSAALPGSVPAGQEAVVAPLPDPHGKASHVPLADMQASSANAQPLSDSAPPVTATAMQAADALAHPATPAPGHQQVLEDLLVGHAVDEQWVDRLSRDVQALVASDNREARLHLRPRELGDLAIRLNIADGQAKVHFTVESAAAQALIAEAVPRLQSMMESKGFRLDQAAVDVGGQGTGAGRNGAGAGQADGQRTEPASMARAPAAAVEAAVRAAARQTAFERYA